MLSSMCWLCRKKMIIEILLMMPLNSYLENQEIFKKIFQNKWKLQASNNLDFEKASIFRDRIKSLNIIQSSQRVNEANLS